MDFKIQLDKLFQNIETCMDDNEYISLQNKFSGILIKKIEYLNCTQVRKNAVYYLKVYM